MNVPTNIRPTYNRRMTDIRPTYDRHTTGVHSEISMVITLIKEGLTSLVLIMSEWHHQKRGGKGASIARAIGQLRTEFGVSHLLSFLARIMCWVEYLLSQQVQLQSLRAQGLGSLGRRYTRRSLGRDTRITREGTPGDH